MCLTATPSRSSREENSSKLAAVARAFRMVCRSFSLFVSDLVCQGVIPPAIMGGVLLVQRGPILPVGHAVLAAVQEVDLVKPLPVAHLHDFGLEVSAKAGGAVNGGAMRRSS